MNNDLSGQEWIEMSSTPTAPLRREIIITGFGGQGIILAGQIMGKAACLGDHRESTLTQSYGPEARGGACCAQVIISDRTIHYPYVRQADVVVSMSRGGLEKYGSLLKAEGIMLIDQDLVGSVENRWKDLFAIPATRMAEELGRKMMANIVILGFFTAITEAVSVESARTTIMKSVPSGTEELNLTAFNKGYDFGMAVLKGRRKKAEGRKGAAA
jgi:2-oxoglutarate ferredoxin oxidoreductase subunit gamma